MAHVRNGETRFQAPLPGWRTVIAAAALLLGLSSAVPVAAVDVTAGSSVIDVRVVNVEAVVTDRDGVRVHDLGPDAFRLEVDGEERPIDYFAEVRGGDVIRTEGGSGTHPSPFLGVEPGRPRGTSYLLFIDDYFSIARDRDHVLDAIESELPELRPEDRMAIVSFDGDHLRMLTSWTGSAQKIQEALREERATGTGGLDRLAELRTNDQLIKDRFHLFTRPFRTELTGLERDYALRLASQLQRSVRAASATLRGFANPPGRKVMLLLSGGWPFSPAEYTVDTYFSTFEDTLAGTLESGVPGRSRLYEPLTTTANLLGYTIYPVDVPGLESDRDMDASKAIPRPVASRSFDREDEVEHTLTHLAAETGGEALLDGRRGEPLQIVAQDTSSYYWLGFTAKRDEDDNRHDIRVVATRPGLRVRTREDYVDLSRSQEMDLVVESALYFGNPPSNEPLDVKVGDMRKVSAGRSELPLEIGIPMSAIYLEHEHGQHVADLQLRLQAIGPDGAISDTAHQEVRIRESAAPAPGQSFVYSTTLKLRPKTERVVVAVFDPVGGAVLSRIVDLQG